MSRIAPDRTAALTPRRETPGPGPGHTLAAGDTPPPPPYPFLAPPAADGEIGRVGQYRVLKLLGAGGMGMVFAAEDVALQRSVALKVMRPEIAADPSGGWQRFLREARAQAALKHPNLVTVYQAFQERDSVFLVMELLAGESLEERVRRPEFTDPHEVVRIATEIASGLAALHDSGLIHRDIKPANIWLEAPGDRVKILDLGLVRSVREDTHLTEAGMVVGTPAYMSPEQVRGWPLDARTDLFSFGCVLYALCTGRPPFQADNPMAQAAALAADDPAPVCELNPDIPKPLSDLVARLLAKNPDDRPPSAAAVIERLRAIGRPAATVVEEPKPQPEPRPAPKARSGKSRRSKAAKAKKPRPSFARRNAVALVAGLWVVVAALVAAALIGRGDKPAGGTPNPPEAGSPPAKAPEAVFLSEFPASRVTAPPFRPNPPDFDGTIIVGKRVSPHGILLHPSPPHLPPANLAYRLGKEYRRFNAEVAFNDTAPPDAPPAIFAVYLDGKLEWQSGPISRNDPPKMCDLDVTGATDLTLEVRVEGPERGVHAVWVEPRLTK
jgi:serine/threonine protein kinase